MIGRQYQPEREKNATEDYGNRQVTYANLGKPITVTFVKNRATSIHAD